MGTILRRYTHGVSADDPVAWFEGSAMTSVAQHMLLADHQGSIVAVADASGTPVGIDRYDEWGVPEATNIGRFQYTGQVWLPDLGMYHYKARIYSPTLGRFLQTDPIGYDDQVNLNAYVGNDPVNATDPTGMERRDEGSNSARNIFGDPCDSKGGGERASTSCSGQSVISSASAHAEKESATKIALDAVAAAWDDLKDHMQSSALALERVPEDIGELWEGLLKGKIEWALSGLPPTAGGALTGGLIKAPSAAVYFGKNANGFFHTWRHVLARGHDAGRVHNAIMRDIGTYGWRMKVGSDLKSTVVINGTKFIYSIYRKSNREFNVSSIRPPRP